MTDEVAWLAGVLEDEWALATEVDVYYGQATREPSGDHPMHIKVYKVSAPSPIPKGIGYKARDVHHYLTIDLRGIDYEDTLAAKDEIIRILGLHAVDPMSGYNWMVWDDGTPHAGYVGFYWWTFEVEIKQFRKLVR